MSAPTLTVVEPLQPSKKTNNRTLSTGDEEFSIKAKGSGGICSVCSTQYSRYTCPRCNSTSCSLECYKAHSPQCTEAFHSEGLRESMKDTQVEDQAKREMLQVLKRVYGGDSEEEEEGEEEAVPVGSEQRLLSDETLRQLVEGGLEHLSLGALPQAERDRFLEAARQGHLSHLLTPWTPWWEGQEAREVCLDSRGMRLVQDLSTPDDHTEAAASESAAEGLTDTHQHGEDSHAYTSAIPPPPDHPLPEVSSLLGSGREPSPQLRWHLLDLLHAYCSTLRRYNGDWEDEDVGDLVACLVDCSAVLTVGAQTGRRPGSRSARGKKQAGVSAEREEEEEGKALGSAHGSTPHQPTLPSSAKAALRGAAVLARLSRCPIPPPVMLGDVAVVLSAGRGPVVCALAHMTRLVAKALDTPPPPPGGYTLQATTTTTSQVDGESEETGRLGRGRRGGGGGNGSEVKSSQRSALRKVSHKLHFLTAWANSLGDSDFQLLSSLVEDEIIRESRRSPHHTSSNEHEQEIERFQLSKPQSSVVPQNPALLPPRRLIHILDSKQDDTNTVDITE